ncbi:uncharacterized protein BT62DRAFT_1071697 [Guyanagaster necrorhizus]|uniref:DUF6593 domain-containing protein n=1 Tax=Guyanagaster necrorhizus TaxID=856835 RepID=A0A9P8AWV9_9AGAR|nr:uncharacterized protein BT62DRAFT_1071697 [Guyanagaster necrorhizus MCA 3950]KAG7451099.1 hypothetical protein BT62DRAFT_1071697 [Guyanagaster necrorhizus MCA 3950]
MRSIQQRGLAFPMRYQAYGPTLSLDSWLEHLWGKVAAVFFMARGRGDGGKTIYQVYTQNEPSTATFVKNTAGDVIASWEWREIRSDIITLGGASPTPVSSWSKKSIVPFKEYGNGPGLFFEPIVRFQKSRRAADSTHTPTQLIFDERAEEIRDLVVISFPVLEKSRRKTESSTMNKAHVLTQPAFAALGSTNYVLKNGGT